LPPADHRITLITRVGCHLCEQASVLLIEMSTELGFGYEEQDVDADEQLRSEYGDHVPVILLNGREHGYWRVEPERLRRALAR
jgi:glutaredoxin